MFAEELFYSIAAKILLKADEFKREIAFIKTKHMCSYKWISMCETHQTIHKKSKQTIPKRQIQKNIKIIIIIKLFKKATLNEPAVRPIHLMVQFGRLLALTSPKYFMLMVTMDAAVCAAIPVRNNNIV